MSPLLLVVMIMFSAAGSQPQTALLDRVCHVSDYVQDRPPDDPHADSFASHGATWYANSERTMWAWWWGKTYTGAYKVLWVRPQGAKLTVTGHRLDGAAPPVTADIPSGDQWTFQVSGVSFPTAGCWQVDARAGRETITLIVKIP